MQFMKKAFYVGKLRHNHYCLYCSILDLVKFPNDFQEKPRVECIAIHELWGGKDTSHCVNGFPYQEGAQLADQMEICKSLLVNSCHCSLSKNCTFRKIHILHPRVQTEDFWIQVIPTSIATWSWKDWVRVGFPPSRPAQLPNTGTGPQQPYRT